jgi:hypothetical protein
MQELEHRLRAGTEALPAVLPTAATVARMHRSALFFGLSSRRIYANG